MECAGVVHQKKRQKYHVDRSPTGRNNYKSSTDRMPRVLPTYRDTFTDSANSIKSLLTTFILAILLQIYRNKQVLLIWLLLFILIFAVRIKH